MNFFRLFAVSAISVSALCATGCASIISDSQYPVSLVSTPTGANFEVRNEAGTTVHSGTTPSTVTLKSGDGFFSGAHYTVSFKKEGYSDQLSQISPTIDGWYVANILFGGLIGLLIVDPATGAMYKLPENSRVSMTPLTTEFKNDSINLNVVSIATLSEEQRAGLIRIN